MFPPYSIHRSWSLSTASRSPTSCLYTTASPMRTSRWARSPGWQKSPLRCLAWAKSSWWRDPLPALRRRTRTSSRRLVRIAFKRKLDARNDMRWERNYQCGSMDFDRTRGKIKSWTRFSLATWPMSAFMASRKHVRAGPVHEHGRYCLLCTLDASLSLDMAIGYFRRRAQR